VVFLVAVFARVAVIGRSAVIVFLGVLGIRLLGVLLFLGGLVMAYALGISMNMLTMFALIVVLGMIVDDAIVVGENAYRHMEEGLSPVQAAIQGTIEVGKPVMATILTTIAAFLPTLMISGMMGKFMRPLPIIVTFCLIASLFEAAVDADRRSKSGLGDARRNLEGFCVRLADRVP